MERAKKAEVVESLNGLFNEAGSVVVAHYTGLTVAEMSDLRARMRAAGASFKVAKNRLVVRALKGTAAEPIAHLFKGPTGIAYSNDPIAASKVAAAYAKENDKLVILGGVVGAYGAGCRGRESPGRTAVARRTERQDRGPASGTRDQDCRRPSGARWPAGPRHQRVFQQGSGVIRRLNETTESNP